MAVGVSVHIGVDELDPAHYGGWEGVLRSCEADADRMAAIATSQGMAAVTLTSADATLARVGDALRRHARVLGPGDLLLVTYAGHGGRVPDVDGDEADDLWDETWCLYDGQLVDDEQHDLYCAFARGVRIVVVSDSCHSGTVTRAAPPARPEAPWGGRYRAVPATVELRAFDAHRADYVARQADVRRRHGGRPEPVATVRLLGACQDDQQAVELDDGGLFTSALQRVWRSGSARSYAALMADVTRQMPPEQRPNHVVYGTAAGDEQPFRV